MDKVCLCCSPCNGILLLLFLRIKNQTYKNILVWCFVNSMANHNWYHSTNQHIKALNNATILPFSLFISILNKIQLLIISISRSSTDIDTYAVSNRAALCTLFSPLLHSSPSIEVQYCLLWPVTYGCQPCGLDLGCYKWYQSQILGDVSRRTLDS